MTGYELLNRLNKKEYKELFSSLYGTEGMDFAFQRYERLAGEMLNDSIFPESKFPEAVGDLRIFSVPGRTELGGNHTDHNRGKVFAASIQLDAVAIVAPRADKQVFFRSRGHDDVLVDIGDLSIKENEKGKADALIRGIAAEFAARGSPVEGFTANADNMVLTGSGLSSSAAVEVLIAKIFDNLYCGGKRSALELAQIGQKAENVHFGKPCGLMDQTACASGGAVAIDFKDLQNPIVKEIGFDPAAAGFALTVVDTKGTHADLTPDYAAIPAEMKAAAAFYGKNVLRELDEESLLSRLSDLRKAAGDRAVLRALHFFNENRLVDKMLVALEKLDSLPTGEEARLTTSKWSDEKGKAMEDFLALVRESGNSSWELLQNVFSVKFPNEQGVSLAQALTRKFLESSGSKGACRVHGGGFAGTIQAYLPLDKLGDYQKFMEGVFGNGSVTVLRIRPVGAIEIGF
ncbi:MAG: galactokinase [Treponema sp.]|nr:galactokinase [Treponema sp.]